jgi:DNA-binding NarL/FixJ family response regulator
VAAAAEPEGPGRGPRRLLIVEDHELLAGTLALALRQRGLDVQTAAGPTPEAVVERARALAPVLVLLDLDLGPPLGSGLDLVRPLSEAGGRVVMMTGVTDRARLAACVEAGATGVVAKTAAFEALIDAVRRAAEGETLLREDERQALLAELRARRRAEGERMAPFGALSPREQAVLAGLVAGDSAETIAARSYVSMATVRSQIRAILLKLGVRSQLAAVAMARDAGWPPDPPA